MSTQLFMLVNDALINVNDASSVLVNAKIEQNMNKE